MTYKRPYEYKTIYNYLYQLRKRSSLIRKWDNGNAFYESLDPAYKEEYWHKDTHIVNMFFIILLLAIRESIKLQKKYKKVH